MRSIYNHVARDLTEGYDVSWRLLRAALDTAHLAIDSADLYRMEGYGDTREYVPARRIDGTSWGVSAGSETTDA